MTQALLTRDELIDRLLLVFREHGYDGSTLTEIARATGLGKASLYHHFPGGKGEMADALVRVVCARLNSQVYAALGSTAPPADRLASMFAGLDSYLAGGSKNDLLGVFALGPQRERFSAVLNEQTSHWLRLLASTLEDAGHSPKAARRLARDAMVRIQGALVLGRLLGSTKPWRQLMKRLPRDLLAT